ncbi:MAG: class I SAM-dependent methyltransferase [Thermodesulfobacteriota bacterium]
MRTWTSYDDVPYLSAPNPECHPDRLFTLGRLFGLTTPPVATARVLELGCSDGGNLLAAALNLPEAQFMGVDLSRRQVEIGRRAAEALGCRNLRLDHAGLTDVDASWGLFDYIICRGVYSWVPAVVQDKILEIFSTNLADRGVAYLDYNTYPGWHVLEPVRDLMRFHTAGLDEPREAIGQAMAVADLLANFIQPDNEDYVRLMQREIGRIAGIARDTEGATYIYHEYLEAENRPVYFSHLAWAAERHGLQYLGEAVYADMLTHGFPQDLAEIMADLGRDLIRLEQYMDFLRNRRFRRSLFCRQGPVLDRRVHPEDLTGLLVSCTKGVTREVIGQALAEGSPAKTALTCLLEVRPRAVPLGSLRDEVDRRLGRAPTETGDLDLARDLIGLYSVNAVQFHSWQADFTLVPGRRPRLCDLARYQLSQGQRWLSSQCHRPALLPGPLLDLARLLDGARDKEELAAFIHRGMQEGAITIQVPADQPAPTPPELSPAEIENLLNQMLARIASEGLLVE